MNIILFCQAPADLPYVLKIYQDNRGINKVSIYVVNVYNVYKFIRELNLELEKLIFIPYELKDLTQLHKYYAERKRLHAIWQEHIRPTLTTDVYFFSVISDWITSYYICKLLRSAYVRKVYYADHYDLLDKRERRSIPSIQMLKLGALLYVLTQIKFKLDLVIGLIEFPYQKYPIEKKIIVKEELDMRPFYYTLPVSASRKKALFFVNTCETEFFSLLTYDTTAIQVIHTLHSAGWYVVVKGHPRLGIPDCIQEAADWAIPSYIIGEFINPADFSLCLGISTSAISHFISCPAIKVYSLIHLFDAVSLEAQKRMIDYLNILTDNKVRYIKDLKGLAHL